MIKGNFPGLSAKNDIYYVQNIRNVAGVSLNSQRQNAV